ncbi:MAG: hypothetical protein RIB97_09620 [Nitratireductor sp.]
MTSRSAAACLGGVALTLFACEDPGPKSTLIYLAPQGSERVLADAARFHGGVPVHVDGRAWGEDEDALSRRAAQWIAAAVNRPDWRFQPAGRAPRGDDGARIILSIDPKTGFSGVSLCQGRRLTEDGAPDPMTLRLVICDDNRRSAEALLTLPRPAQADAPALRDLVKQAARAAVARRTERGR